MLQVDWCWWFYRFCTRKLPLGEISPHITVSRSFQWSNRPFETRYICSASSLFSGDISFPSEISIIYMAGSPNLLAAEADPFFDFKSHFDELSTFLEGVSLLRCSLKFSF